MRPNFKDLKKLKTNRLKKKKETNDVSKTLLNTFQSLKKSNNPTEIHVLNPFIKRKFSEFYQNPYVQAYQKKRLSLER
jgi:hypothetical protein